MMHGFLGKCSRWCHNKSAGLLVLRLAFGPFMIAHGIYKLQNLAMLKEVFSSMGVGGWAGVVAVSELFVGAAITLGAFLWVAAALQTVIMGVAIWKVVGPNQLAQPFILHYISSWGPNVIYAAIAVALAFCGAGRWSVTNLYFRHRGGKCRDCMAAHGVGHDCPDCPPQHTQQ